MNTSEIFYSLPHIGMGGFGNIDVDVNIDMNYQ